MLKNTAQVGYDFEDAIKVALKNLEKMKPIFWHQFPDTKQARNFLGVQPSDFLVTAQRHTYLLEAKASSEHKSLKSCASSHISAQQIGMHKRWHRANGLSYFIFYSRNKNTLELWGAHEVVEARSQSRMLNANSGLIDTVHGIHNLEKFLLRTLFSGL